MRKNEQGFTLIELLVVVAIIGILAAIAIPQFSAYRAQGFNARASSDLRNLATAEEAYFAANAAYTNTLTNLTGFKQSPGVTIQVGSITSTSFTATSNHGSGNSPVPNCPRRNRTAAPNSRTDRRNAATNHRLFTDDLAGCGLSWLDSAVPLSACALGCNLHSTWWSCKARSSRRQRSLFFTGTIFPCDSQRHPLARQSSRPYMIPRFT